MKILSLYFGHDANLTLLDDGIPVQVLEKERLTRIKHDHGSMDVEAILAKSGWTPDDIDLIVINPFCRQNGGDSPPWNLEGETFQTRPDYKLYGWRGNVEERYSHHRIKMMAREYPCIAMDHHLAHSALALFSSPFEEAAILSADGGGDLRNCAIAYGSGHRLKWIEYGWGMETAGECLNIGSTWDSIGQYHFQLGSLEGAGKLMGLSSYGAPDPVLCAMIERHMRYYAYHPLPLNLIGQWSSQLDPLSSRAQDLCASLQQVTSEMMLKAADRARELSHAPFLAMTGGCAMNCIANTRIHHSGLFQDTFVPAQPHDGGLSLGQALFAWHHVLENSRKPAALSPYLGNDAGPSPPQAIIAELIDHLEQGRTLGLCYGRAESGPRALGHRSILMDPRRSDGRDHLNFKIKFREWYRPFAPMILPQFCQVPSPYMSYVQEVSTDFPAVRQVDGTTRPQRVSPSEPFLYELLDSWYQQTGCPMLLNTSFNSQEPLVDTCEQARATWRRTQLDVLVTSTGLEIKD